MGTNKNLGRKLSFFFINFLVTNILMFSQVARSEIYTVGGDEEWNSAVNFGLWANNYNFTVGDVLVFKYVKGQHNVYQVTEPTYRSCDTNTGVIARFDTGDDHIELTEPKKYWFICDVAGHCITGMRVAIDVSAGNTKLPMAEPTPEFGPPPPPASSGNKREFVGLQLVLFVVVLSRIFWDISK